MLFAAIVITYALFTAIFKICAPNKGPPVRMVLQLLLACKYVVVKAQIMPPGTVLLRRKAFPIFDGRCSMEVDSIRQVLSKQWENHRKDTVRVFQFIGAFQFIVTQH